MSVCAVAVTDSRVFSQDTDGHTRFGSDFAGEGEGSSVGDE